MTNTERSQLFKVYGSTRRLVREGKLDAGRVNRALGVAQSCEGKDYETTLDGCTCPDYQYRQGPKGEPCKHILALAMLTIATEPAAELVEPAPEVIGEPVMGYRCPACDLYNPEAFAEGVTPDRETCDGRCEDDASDPDAAHKARQYERAS